MSIPTLRASSPVRKLVESLLGIGCEAYGVYSVPKRRSTSTIGFPLVFTRKARRLKANIHSVAWAARRLSLGSAFAGFAAFRIFPMMVSSSRSRSGPFPGTIESGSIRIASKVTPQRSQSSLFIGIPAAIWRTQRTLPYLSGEKHTHGGLHGFAGKWRLCAAKLLPAQPPGQLQRPRRIARRLHAEYAALRTDAVRVPRMVQYVEEIHLDA